MDRLAELIANKKKTDRVLICGKDVYDTLMHGIPAKLFADDGTLVHCGLEVRLDESKEAGYVEIS